jgi:hypothetical protein
MRPTVFPALVAAAMAASAAAGSWAQNRLGPSSAEGNPTPASRQHTTAEPVAPKEPAPPPAVTVIGAADAHSVLGRDVRSLADEDMGHIVDVVVDRAGGPRAAIIDFGGFLGVGSRKIAVDWNALHFGGVASKTRQYHAGIDQGSSEGGTGIQGG